MAAAVGVQLVEDQESEVAELADEPAIEVPREHQLEHHVVGEDDVGRVLPDLLAFLVVLLAGVAPVGDRRAMTPRAVAEELVEFFLLAVGQGVHRVDDDRLDALARAGPQDVVDDRDDVAEALARTGAGREDVVAIVAC